MHARPTYEEGNEGEEGEATSAGEGVNWIIMVMTRGGRPRSHSIQVLLKRSDEPYDEVCLKRILQFFNSPEALKMVAFLMSPQLLAVFMQYHSSQTVYSHARGRRWGKVMYVLQSALSSVCTK